MAARPRRKQPNDGPGPRGFPDSYYTSRTLDSTFRYVRFVKKLRQWEDEQRKGTQDKKQKMKDTQINDFFNHCDRKQLVNGVARRVELCMRSYQADLDKKKARLKEQLSKEEAENIRKFVVQAQAAKDTIWEKKMARLQYLLQKRKKEHDEKYKDTPMVMLSKEEAENIRNFVVQAQAAKDTIWEKKMARLQYLLQKRKKEHDEKYKDTPISKCTHVQPCLVQRRAMEAQEFQLYQIKEKEAMRESEKEFDRMWHEVAMKGAEALAARMEVEEIERYRRNVDCKNHTNRMLEQRERERAVAREKLKKEQIAIKARMEEIKREERAEEEARREKHMQAIRECKEAIADRNEIVEKKRIEQEKLQQIWDSLYGQGVQADTAKHELMKRKEQELDQCNLELIKMRDEVKTLTENPIFDQQTKEIQDLLDRKRCDYLLWSQKTNREVRKAMIDQIQDRKDARQKLKEKMAEEEEYQEQVQNQLKDLLTHKEIEDAKIGRKHQLDLFKQIEYNKLLKERALQEELEQRKRATLASKEYQDEINRMLCRPAYTDEIHPFMKQMTSSLEMRRTCPCARRDYCARPDDKPPDTFPTAAIKK